MRISWLAADVVSHARSALQARSTAWDDHFTPEFEAPAPPVELIVTDWERVAEHVARAERVSEVVRQQGLAAARAAFGDSPHAIEVATVAAAALQAEELRLDDVVAVLRREVDELLFYAPFLELLLELGRDDLPAAVAVYEAFVAAYQASPSTSSDRRQRVSAVRDGLASVYVAAGRFDDGDALFAVRHEEDRDDLAVALSASRSFLAAGEVSRAVHWLGIGAERAEILGRPEMATRLRDKATTLRQRLS